MSSSDIPLISTTFFWARSPLGRQSFTFRVPSARHLSCYFSFLQAKPPSAHHLFDGMAQRSRAKKVAMSDQEDRLSTLPNGVLQHVLGFLPAHEVVRTSVLALRWRHVWRSVRRLHITCPFDGTCSNCRGDDNHKGRCVLIGGLSSAVNLKLTAHSGKVHILTSNFSMCRFVSLCQFPFFLYNKATFSKLKKLLLNDWCVAVDLGALVCILKHSPVLENLTLQLRKVCSLN
jgi:hypothetical protein